MIWELPQSCKDAVMALQAELQATGHEMVFLVFAKVVGWGCMLGCAHDEILPAERARKIRDLVGEAMEMRKGGKP
jgi:hypothetical protein